jgi:SAM-dependent methyltransferase
MDLKELELLAGAPEDHWYYASKACALLECLRGRQPVHVLDVGAGSGFFSRMVLRHTAATGATCVDVGYAREWSEEEHGKSIDFRPSLRPCNADLVLLMDVLEHVVDDAQLLRECAGHVPAGARFIVTVPAFAWLWSGHDDFLGHHRRYTLRQLIEVIGSAGLDVEGGFYFMAAVLPAVAATRLPARWLRRNRPASSDLRSHHPLTNWLLKRVCIAECRVACHNRAFGLTAFATALKR